jgi:hypothetical protein
MGAECVWRFLMVRQLAFTTACTLKNEGDRQLREARRNLQDAQSALDEGWLIVLKAIPTSQTQH